MACNPLIPATCIVDAGGDAVADAAGAAIGNQFAEAMADGAAWVLETTIGWWVDVPAVDLTTSPSATIRGYVLWLAIAVATVGVMWQGVLLVLSRRPDPLLSIGRGLFTFALFASIGIIAPAAALRAGDAFSSWVLDESTDGRAIERLSTIANLSAVSSPGAIIVLGLLLMLSGLAQAVVMIFREGAVVVLAGVVVLAAAGSFAHATRPWLHRVVGWMAALIAYKPIAALVYATALAMVGEDNDPRTLLVGLTMIVLAIFALPALMKFFTWTTGSISSGGAGGTAAALGASASAIHATSSLSSGGASASTQASHIRHDLGSPIAAGAVPASAPSGALTGAGKPPAMAGAGAPAAGTAGVGGVAAGVTSGAAAGAGPIGVAAVAGSTAVDAAKQASAAAQRHVTDGGGR